MKNIIRLVVLPITLFLSCESSISDIENKIDYFPLYEGIEYRFNYKFWEGDWIYNTTERGVLFWKVVKQNNAFRGNEYIVKSQITGQSISRRWNDGVGFWYDSVTTQRNEILEFVIEESLDSITIPRKQVAFYEHTYGKFTIPRFTEINEDTLSLITNEWDQVKLLKNAGLYSYKNGDGGNYSWGIIVEKKYD
jgi:hypothetical protein